MIEDKNAILPIDAAIQANLRETTTRVLATLTPGEERIVRMRFGIGMNTDRILSDARANSADRGQGAEEAEAPESIKHTQELPQ